MKLTNQEIYNYANNLAEAFQDREQTLPIKINFYLQKNKKTLMDLAMDVEQARTSVAQKYGTLTEDGTKFEIPPEHIETVSKELTELFSLEQDVQIYTVNIDSFSDDLTITTAQMEAIMFMID